MLRPWIILFIPLLRKILFECLIYLQEWEEGQEFFLENSERKIIKMN